MNSVVLITKDAMMSGYLPTYGNKYWKTPNIDALASKGTVFRRHYAGAPSTIMSFLAMCTGRFPYEFVRAKYKPEGPYEGHTIFDRAKEMGMDPHIFWCSGNMDDTFPYANCFRGCNIHNAPIDQPVGAHKADEKPLKDDIELEKSTMSAIYGVLDEIPKDNVFLWFHVPHVILGRICYGADIDLFDDIVGYLREKYGDDSIYVSADHGNMNGDKGIYTYGFHVYEPAVRIPLITPSFDEQFIDYPTSNADLETIIFDHKIPKRDYVLTESTYALQPYRRTAIIKDNFKYIYNKYEGTEELYDLEYDPEESRNLISETVWDSDRETYYNLFEIYFYPKVNDLPQKREEMRAILASFWYEASKSYELYLKTIYSINKKFPWINNTRKSIMNFLKPQKQG